MQRLDLELIAARLEGLEETVINRLVDRAQFARNAEAYRAGGSEFPDEPQRSLFEVRLRYQEEMDSRFARYRVPEERPVNGDLPEPERTTISHPAELAVTDYDAVNLSPQIAEGYLAFVPRLCAKGDDGNYGSSVEHDVLAIQAIARRIHYGALYVSESKYRESPDEFDQLLNRGDRGAVLSRIERPEVEARILSRVAAKVDYVQAQVNTRVRRIVAPEIVLELYRDLIIPLTKEGQLRYLATRPRERREPPPSAC